MKARKTKTKQNTTTKNNCYRVFVLLVRGFARITIDLLASDCVFYFCMLGYLFTKNNLREIIIDFHSKNSAVLDQTK